MPRTPDLVVESRSRLDRNAQATARVQDRKVVAIEVVATLSNTRRIAGISPDSSFALPFQASGSGLPDHGEGYWTRNPTVHRAPSHHPKG